MGVNNQGIVFAEVPHDGITVKQAAEQYKVRVRTVYDWFDLFFEKIDYGEDE